MIGRKGIISLAFLTACLLGVVAASGASALTAVTCGGVVNGGWNDANCETATPGSGAFGHITFTGATKTTLENDAPLEVTMAKLHGFSNVEISCAKVSGSGTIENFEGVTVVGTGKVALSECTTNQAACSVSVAETEFEFEAVAPEAEAVGLKFKAKSPATKITTVTFSGGTCGLKAFGPIPVAGSATATASGEPKGSGAQTVFSGGTMSALTVGGETAVPTGKVTIKGPNGNRIVITP